MRASSATYSFKITNRAGIVCNVALLPGLFSSLEEAVASGRDIHAFLSDPTTMIIDSHGLAELSCEETISRSGIASFFEFVRNNRYRVTRITIQTDVELNLNSTITLEEMFPQLGGANKPIYINDYLNVNSVFTTKLVADLESKGDAFVIDDQKLVLLDIQPHSEMVIGLHLVPDDIRECNH